MNTLELISEYLGQQIDLLKKDNHMQAAYKLTQAKREVEEVLASLKTQHKREVAASKTYSTSSQMGMELW